MKLNSVNSRKLRYGGVTAALTAFTIVVVLLLNVLISALAAKFTWYIDMTPDLLFTLSDEAVEIIRSGDPEFDTASPIAMVDSVRAKNKAHNQQNGLSKGDEGYLDEMPYINIIFCDDADNVQSDSSKRYVYNTATELQSKFPDHIKVVNYNIYRNPSAVDKYRTTVNTKLSTDSVILEFGTEYRLYSTSSFYLFDSETDEAWAYNGDKKFTSGILAVTRAESPIACFTSNHGEQTPDAALYNTLTDAGFLVDTVDLSSGEEIPKDCRLIIIFNPQSDFSVKTAQNEIDEIDRLDEFLDGTNSLMVFIDPYTNAGNRLPNLEDYLEEWGVSYNRYSMEGKEYPGLVKDSSNSLTTNGFTLVSEYVEYGLGGSFTAEMRESTSPKPVIFPNSMSLSYSDLYQTAHYVNPEDDTDQYDYGKYYSNGVSRSIMEAFVSASTAVSHANGQLAAEAKHDPFKLMTISKEDRSVQEDNSSVVREDSYVVAFGSTQFASSEFLESSSYGNADLLLSVFREIGKEPVPVGMGIKPFADYTIDTITTKDATIYTVTLTVVPALIAIVAGAIVLIRRKNK